MAEEGLTLVQKDYGAITQDYREEYVRWFLNALLTAQAEIQLEEDTGQPYEGPRYIKDILQVTGPHGMRPDSATVWRWLKSDWAKAIRSQVGADVNTVVAVETDAEWVQIMRNQRFIARTAKGRDAVMAAKFVDEVRQRGGFEDSSALGKKIADLIGSGRFDVEVQAVERTVRLKKTAEAPAIDVTPRAIP